MTRSPIWDAVILGAGAAGLMCAIEAARRGKRVIVLDHAAKPAEKIRISGGGRCNFTNLNTAPSAFLSDNPRFCISALRRFTAQDFVSRVRSHGIPYHEKTLGQLFCDDSAHDIINMLLRDLDTAGGQVQLKTEIRGVSREGVGFRIETSAGAYAAKALVLATGGLSIPKMGATGLAYELARQFGHSIVPTRAGLVPITFGGDALEPLKALAGVALPVRARFGKVKFDEAMLFTHRGLSGPAVLQISSYWQPGMPLELDLWPDGGFAETLRSARTTHARQDVLTILSQAFPRRLAEALVAELGLSGRMADLGDKGIERLTRRVSPWSVRPLGTEGYRTAEVTVGGVNTRELSSQTLESQLCPGLYVIGEAADVTGHLGG